MSVIFDFSHFPVLHSERLTLRALEEGDTQALIALFSDPQVLRYLNQDPTDTVEKALGLIAWFDGMYRDHEAVTWAISRHDDSSMIGMTGTYAWDRGDRHVDIGYHILPAHWTQGYATEASRIVIRWCFDNLDVHRVQADCTEGNLASERVLLKCGFTVEGIWRESCWEHGRFVNIKQFGLLRHEAGY